MKLTRPLAQTTAQQVKPLTHEKSDSKCQRNATMSKEGKMMMMMMMMIMMNCFFGIVD